MKETDITAKCLKHLNAQSRCVARKQHASQYGNVGEPDIDGCWDGRALKIEVKMPGKKPTPLQMAAMRRWERAGALAGWVTSLDEMLELLDHVDDPGWVNPQLVKEPDQPDR